MSIIYKKAETQEEMDKIFELWFEIFCVEENFRDPKNYPNKKDVDEYNGCSTYFIAKKDNELIGAIRLISYKCTKKFLIEKVFELPEFLTSRRETALEISRGAVKKEHRGEKILLGLLKIAYEYARDNKYQYLCGAMVPIVMNVLKKAKWHFEWVGEKKQIYTVIATPVVLKIENKNVNFKITPPDK